ncbi:MAG TPA: hypothetical protein VEV19_06285 [Ktedonobacteraceae bacterium]|nr:hypothetical protein [Ktedonobacteraceae bacterium]
MPTARLIVHAADLLGCPRPGRAYQSAVGCDKSAPTLVLRCLKLTPIGRNELRRYGGMYV